MSYSITKNTKKVNETRGRIKYLYITDTIRTCILVLLILLFAMPGGYWYIVETRQKFTTEKSPVYSYTNKAAVNYNVFILPNEVIPEKSLGEGAVYISELVDYIEMIFSHSFIGDGEADLDETYSATATLEGYIKGEQSEKILWKKEYILQPVKNVMEKGKEINVQYKVPVYFRTYNVYINRVREILKVDSNVRLVVQFKISVESKSDKGTVSEELSPTLEMEMDQGYFTINGTPSDEKSGTIDENKTIISPLYTKKRILCWVLMGVSLLALLYMLIFTRNLELGLLQKRLDQLLNKYGSRIVVLNSRVKTDKKEMIEVSSFDGLIKIADDISKPIFYENMGEAYTNFKFYVVDSDIYYQFDLDKCFIDQFRDMLTKKSDIAIE